MEGEGNDEELFLGGGEGDSGDQDVKPADRVAGFAQNHQVTMSSKYNVLSQSQAALRAEDTEGVVDLTMDDDTVAARKECRREVCAQGLSAYSDFMPCIKSFARVWMRAQLDGDSCKEV